MRKIFFLIYITFLNITCANAIDCNDEVDELGVLWTRQVARTQAGGWIWFPGKGISKDKEEALLLAEGIALERMTYECNNIHRETKIHERCIESRWGEYIAHVRLSIEDKNCKISKGDNSKKFINHKLTSRHRSYLKLIQNRKYKDRKGCKIGDIKRCVDIANSFWAKNEKNAAYFYAGVGCEEGDGSSCFMLGYFHLNDKNYFKSAEYSKIACWKKVPEGCNNAGLVFQNNGDQEKAMKYFLLACEKEDKTGCVNLSSIHKKRGDLVRYGKFLYKAALIYKKLGSKTEYMNNLNKACIVGGYKKACKKSKKNNKCVGDGCVFF